MPAGPHGGCQAHPACASAAPGPRGSAAAGSGCCCAGGTGAASRAAPLPASGGSPSSRDAAHSSNSASRLVSSNGPAVAAAGCGGCPCGACHAGAAAAGLAATGGAAAAAAGGPGCPCGSPPPCFGAWSFMQTALGRATGRRKAQGAWESRRLGASHQPAPRAHLGDCVMVLHAARRLLCWPEQAEGVLVCGGGDLAAAAGVGSK